MAQDGFSWVAGKRMQIVILKSMLVKLSAGIGSLGSTQAAATALHANWTKLLGARPGERLGFERLRDKISGVKWW